ncbi:MAG: dipeptide epimerase [Pseudomonadota bacterium]
MKLSVTTHERKLVAPFVIARGTRHSQKFIRVTIEDDGRVGMGEASGRAYRGDTPETMAEEIERVRTALEGGVSREGLLTLMPPGGARAAVDAALWDLQSSADNPAWTIAALDAAPSPVATAMTITMGSPDDMRDQAEVHAARPLLKVKLGGGDGRDVERVKAVRAGAPTATLIADGNGGCVLAELGALTATMADLGYALLEQPLAPGDDDALLGTDFPIPLCADESLDTRADVATIARLYQYGNIKLDKAGGLTEGLALSSALKEHGLGLFVGCMVGTARSIAPAFLLTPDARFVDLDGPLWLADDDHPMHVDETGVLSPPLCWGGMA